MTFQDPGRPQFIFFVFRMEVNLKIIENFAAHTDRCWSVDWSPNGQLLSSSGGDKCAKIWGKDNQVITSLNESRTIRYINFEGIVYQKYLEK